VGAGSSEGGRTRARMEFPRTAASDRDAFSPHAEAESVQVVLVAGRVKTADRVGHHDYLAGCALLSFLLEQSPGVSTVQVRDVWPEEERVFDAARALVFYTGGGGKQPFLRSPRRIERIESLVQRGVGIVMIHQAVSYPEPFAGRVKTWTGGAHVPGRSGRGHWRTHHREFPEHPVTCGVRPWKIRDGWLNGIRFVDGMSGVTPLLWSGRRHRGSREGGPADVVCWAYERPEGGRAFCFTGLDAHSAWSVPGLRQLVVNGILWSAGLTVPQEGSPCAVTEAALHGYLTPRRGWGGKVLRSAWRRVRKLTGAGV
jgi:hypothetical protein